MSLNELYEKDDKKEAERVLRESAKSILADEGILESIPEWIRKGQEMIYPEKYEEWEEFVNASATDLYRGFEVMATLTIMEQLQSDKSVEEVLESIKEDRLAREYNRFSNFVFQFSNRGPEFLEKTLPSEKLTQETMFIIEEKKRENTTLSQKHSTAGASK